MRRASPALVPILVPALAISLSALTAAGCKDSKPDYIGFDASTDTGAADVRGDVTAADAGAGDASKSDAVADSGAVDSQSADLVAEAASDAGPTGSTTDSSADAEPGQ